MNVYNLFFNILIYYILIYFAFIVFKIIFGNFNIKDYFLLNNLEFIVKKILSIILNLVIVTLAFLGLYYIAIVDLEFCSNIVAFILIILLIKFSIDFSFYISNNKFIKALTEKIFNKNKKI